MGVRLVRQKCFNLPGSIDGYTCPIHPGLHPGDSHSVRIEHVIKECVIKNKIAFKEQKWLADKITRHPERIDIIGRSVFGAEDILDLHFSRLISKKIPYMIFEMSCNDDEAFEALLFKIGDHTFEYGFTINDGQAFWGRFS
jgi:hypothetical protein